MIRQRGVSGGFVVAASDEWFGAKEALLDPRPPVFDPTAYGTRGKVVDGWETRRHSPTGDDWVIRAQHAHDRRGPGEHRPRVVNSQIPHRVMHRCAAR